MGEIKIAREKREGEGERKERRGREGNKKRERERGEMRGI